MTESPGGPPLGIILVSLLFVLYGLFWILTWGLATVVGNGVVAGLSLVVAVVVLLVAYYLYSGVRLAWWIAVAAIGASTLWRMSLVAGGAPENLSNAVVGLLVLLYLLGRHEYYQPLRA